MLSGGGGRRSGSLPLGLDPVLLLLLLLLLLEKLEEVGSGLLEEQRVETRHGLDGLAVGPVDPLDRLDVHLRAGVGTEVLDEVDEGVRRLEGRDVCRFGLLLSHLELQADEPVDLGIDAVVQGVGQLDVTLVDGHVHRGVADVQDVPEELDEVDDAVAFDVVLHERIPISRCRGAASLSFQHCYFSINMK
ncbi:MAG: hypothetical protein JWO61_203 [Candidatus Saccharibacteria bacterium]|nr:hypothetical protein [Candidatus Saccharibacteria bacterium]